MCRIKDKERPNCSRTCCATAVKNALKIKALNPNANISILYRIYELTALQNLITPKLGTRDHVHPI